MCWQFGLRGKLASYPSLSVLHLPYPSYSPNFSEVHECLGYDSQAAGGNFAGGGDRAPGGAAERETLRALQ